MAAVPPLLMPAGQAEPALAEPALAEPVRAALAVLRAALAVLRAALLEWADLAGMAASAGMVLATSGLLEGLSTLQTAWKQVTKSLT
ncbi:MAG TPA: hypothetical protein VEE84_08540 [Burkholderiaceae bacterium]|nr:hypothetical protein [Burkholderiaceae bacterium]